MKNCNFFFVVGFLAILATLTVKSDGEEERQAPKTWALLVAGSNEWYNYRHQADVCHAYQILHAHGVPDENIIVMMYDDIANAPENPRKGVLINRPNGTNVYKGVVKDYTGKDVTPQNFIKILTGDEEGMKGIGSGKVIKSTKDDRVFVNFVDHGAPGILAFPTSELTVGELQKALKKMFRTKSYDEMVMYIEACESGSMFKDVLPKNMKIFVTTAANYDESSYACYFDEEIENYLGDCYSVHWMEDTDKSDIEKETVYQQFLRVKKLTNTSHVEEYGDLTVSKLPVGDFQGEEEAEKIIYEEVEKSPVVSHDVPLVILQKKLAKNEIGAQTQLKNLVKKRKYVEKIYKGLVSLIANNDQAAAQNWIMKQPDVIQDLDCHTRLVHAFSDHCFNFGKSPYALRFAYILANMCNDNVDVDYAIYVFRRTCGSNLIHRDGIN